MMQQILQFFRKTGSGICSAGKQLFCLLMKVSAPLVAGVFRGRDAWTRYRAARSLKKKIVFCSTQAIMVSVGVHLLLLLFAGSIVAIRYAQKQDASFAGENIERPKLERRQLQMPVKMQKLQKKSQKPKVTTRMATAATSSFALPDLAGMGLPGQAGGFARVDTADAGGRDLSKIGSSGSLGFGVSSVNFFGARSSGEKMVFVINASKLMLEDRKGGYMTYQFVKDRIHQMVSGMKAATLFNVVVYSERKQVAVFSPALIPASEDAKTRLLAWLAQINSDPARAGIVPVNYNPQIEYESDVANDAGSWLQAVQAAMEQGADNIFVLCAGWESHGISAAQREKLSGMNPVALAAWRAERGWPQSRVDAVTKKTADDLARGRELLEKENAARAKAGQPPKIVQDFRRYVYEELRFPQQLEYPPNPIGFVETASYRIEHILNHLAAVYQYNYIPKKLDRPKLHFVALIDEEGISLGQGGLDVNSEGMALLQRVASEYRGGFEYLRGAKKAEMLLKNNPQL
jgi:hypothetical protein